MFIGKKLTEKGFKRRLEGVWGVIIENQHTSIHATSIAYTYIFNSKQYIREVRCSEAISVFMNVGACLRTRISLSEFPNFSKYRNCGALLTVY